MRIAAFDIETTDLNANMGYTLCCSFQQIVPPVRFGGKWLPNANPTTYTLALDVENMDQFDPDPDRDLVQQIGDEIAEYDLVLGWNSVQFDMSFLNARRMFFGQPPIHAKFHKDLMWMVGQSQNRIGSRRLATVQQYLKIEEQKTGLDWEVWKRAGKGDPEALKEVIRHCEIDVRVLAEAYWRLLPYVRNLHRAG